MLPRCQHTKYIQTLPSTVFGVKKNHCSTNTAQIKLLDKPTKQRCSINKISVNQKFWARIGNSVASKSVYIKAMVFKVQVLSTFTKRVVIYVWNEIIKTHQCAVFWKKKVVWYSTLEMVHRRILRSFNFCTKSIVTKSTFKHSNGKQKCTT